ncbi:MAG: Hsp20/alpha crystallin family protein [Patescibacteria group bacterium]|nr:Hsp20/alpha crystallin family protein [Patescibacteria group bacterium]
MEENKEDIFAELAKVKSEPKSLKIETEDTSLDLEEEVEGQLTVDVYQNKDVVVVQSTVAGVNPENLEINITNESVTIHGKREKMEKIEEKDYFYQECFWGRFSRSIILPQEVDPEKSTASLKNGVLTIKMPKLNRKKAKKLKVKID